VWINWLLRLGFRLFFIPLGCEIRTVLVPLFNCISFVQARVTRVDHRVFIVHLEALLVPSYVRALPTVEGTLSLSTPILSVFIGAGLYQRSFVVTLEKRRVVVLLLHDWASDDGGPAEKAMGAGGSTSPRRSFFGRMGGQTQDSSFVGVVLRKLAEVLPIISKESSPVALAASHIIIKY
jgi:hypothetical protein